jgi:hypothetical protein
MSRTSRASFMPQYALRTFCSTSARAAFCFSCETPTPALAAATPAEIFPKSHTGWMSLSSVRVKMCRQFTSQMRASGLLVWTQLFGSVGLPSMALLWSVVAV